VKETVDHEQQSQGTDSNDNAERIVDEHSPDEATDNEMSNDEYLNADESAKGKDKAQDARSVCLISCCIHHLIPWLLQNSLSMHFNPLSTLNGTSKVSYAKFC